VSITTIPSNITINLSGIPTGSGIKQTSKFVCVVTLIHVIDGYALLPS
jgi:hypothetical protein